MTVDSISRLAVAASCGLVLAATTAGAQNAGPGTAAALPPSREVSGSAAATRLFPLLSSADVRTAGLVALGIVAVSQLDETLARRFQRPALHGNHGLAATSSVVRTLGDPGALMLSAGTYALGRLTKREGMADLGLHATEAIVVSGAVSGLLKFAIGRARPYLAPGEPGEFGPGGDEFRPGRGLGGYTSFPSGHTTAAFAAASAVSVELGRMNPHAGRIATPFLYGGATLVALSRVYDNKHWVSDVVMGAAVGTFVGRRVVAWQHSHPGNRLDRWLLPTSIAPSTRGVSIGWTVPLQ